MYSVAAERAIKKLIRRRLEFVACYTPVGQTNEVDFTSGEQKKDYIIFFGNGAILNTTEIETFVTDASLLSHSRHFTQGGYIDVSRRGIITNAPISENSSLIVNGLRFDVSKLITFNYTSYKIALVERVNNIDIYTDVTKALISRGSYNDKVLAYIDWLWRAILGHYDGSIPEGFWVWPIAGEAFSDSLNLLPSGIKVVTQPTKSYLVTNSGLRYITNDGKSYITKAEPLAPEYPVYGNILTNDGKAYLTNDGKNYITLLGSAPYTDSVKYVQFGRNSGYVENPYSLEVDGEYLDIAVSMTQVSDPAIQPIVDQFNFLMGRL